ncbi:MULTISPECIES: tryptophan synthase subunit alpha [Methylovorus]|jgi:tryptophan synthase alpha chain|uniref:tryptophan synthase subunit alpha n=1 Tax=Methylovorus TaxID=81682 RepID=UPI0001EC4771|nr:MULTISPECIES: tryptophan synthase subunit alpha [Methylovorus]ADQ84765.1 tryptophan synthase, alpha subunit [Methylovorus sp. MP688]KAF0843823.1 tryptophan synthase alpha chain [Methylovorus glucosotrophus]
MSRIKTTFDQLKQQGKKALIPYITAGDPHPDQTVKLLHAMVANGADMIELGVPFSDPMADGPVIQRASERALVHHVGLSRVLDIVREFRQQDNVTPIILMGYANPVEAMGQEKFSDRAKAAGVDGVLTVDYPPEECKEFTALLQARGIDPIFLLSPTTEPARVEVIVNQASGFVYYVSLKGVTGAKNLDIEEVAQKVAEIRTLTDLPVGVGFGVRDAATATAVAAIGDAVVVGSRMVQAVEQSNDQNLVDNVAALMKELRIAVDAA